MSPESMLQMLHETIFRDSLSAKMHTLMLAKGFYFQRAVQSHPVINAQWVRYISKCTCKADVIPNFTIAAGLYSFNTPCFLDHTDNDSQNIVIGISVALVAILVLTTIVAVVLWRKKGFNVTGSKPNSNQGIHLKR